MEEYKRREPGKFGLSLASDSKEAFEILDKLVNWFDYQEYDDITDILYNENFTGQKIVDLFNSCSKSPTILRNVLMKFEPKEIKEIIDNKKPVDLEKLKSLPDKNYYQTAEKNR